jgi:hypothetical protein
METKKITVAEAEEQFKKIPERKTGHWTTLFEEMAKDHQPRRVTGITAGQLAALKRKAKELKFRCKGTDKGTGALILPPEPKK